MKYLLSLLTVLIPLLTFAQHNCNQDVILLNESIQFSIKSDLNNIENHERAADGLSIGCMGGSVYYVDGIATSIYVDGIMIYPINEFNRIDLKRIPLSGTHANEKGLEIAHRITKSIFTSIQRPSTPYGYYPMD